VSIVESCDRPVDLEELILGLVALLACVHACGYDIPLVLVRLDESADRELHDELMATPSERVARMLEALGQRRAGKGR
jgi:hypothetical protein